MSDIHCRKCGEIWDYYYVSHEMPPHERASLMKGLGCPMCRTMELIDESEKEKALASIIDSLNVITDSFSSLEHTMGSGVFKNIIPESEAFCILDQFFISCQIAEQRIKTATKKGYITELQLNYLNMEIGDAVQRMIAISRHFPLLNYVMMHLAETKPMVMGILQSFTSPSTYSAFQHMVRLHEPSDQPPLYRRTWEKGL